MSFSVIDFIPFPAEEYRYTRVNHVYEWEKHVDEVDKLEKMYREDLMTLEQIKEATGINTWVIEDLFREFDIPKMKHKERAKLKRAKDFDLIYKLHIEEKMSLNEIYKKYKFSPLYSKRVLEDKNVQHLGFTNQIKN
ncbi:AraC family transcriptional regulator [Bacillus sp. S13(2024)]|uniref:AraC family transcriptional regulator n=1 Tax=Bacillus sp. S13(2024) TaxID=3162885 RepID=UPI003D1E977A